MTAGRHEEDPHDPARAFGMDLPRPEERRARDGVPVYAKRRQAPSFAPRLVAVPLINQPNQLVAERNKERIALWIFNNTPAYGVFLGDKQFTMPAASGVPSDLKQADVGWPLAGYEKTIVDDCTGELYVGSNLASGTPQLIVVEFVAEAAS